MAGMIIIALRMVTVLEIARIVFMFITAVLLYEAFYTGFEKCFSFSFVVDYFSFFFT